MPLQFQPHGHAVIQLCRRGELRHQAIFRQKDAGVQAPRILAAQRQRGGLHRQIEAAAVDHQHAGQRIVAALGFHNEAWDLRAVGCLDRDFPAGKSLRRPKGRRLLLVGQAQDLQHPRHGGFARVNVRHFLRGFQFGRIGIAHWYS